MNSPAIALVVFIFSYIFFIFLPAKRPHIAIGASILLLVTNTVSIKEAFLSVNWNVMGIFVGTLALADSFMESRVPAYVAEIIINKVKTTTWSILAVCLITGFISAFVENVATVLIVAPIAVSLARKLKISPVNMMIAVAVSSNLQGAATLIGDPPSMLLGGFARMNFMDFFFFKGRPSIFFAVEAGAAASLFVLYFFFKQYRQKPKIIPEEKIRSWVPAGLLAALIVLLALSSFFDTGFSYMAGLICTVFGAFSVLWERAVNKRSVVKAVRKLDWETTLFLMGVFILVGGMTVNGWIDRTS